MKVTIDVVAKKAGVSKATVSRILNGNYLQMTKETKERVLAVINELNYRPNVYAQGLKSTKTNVLGIVLSNLKNPFWATVLEGFEDACKKKGYSVMICNSNEDRQQEEELVRGLRYRKVDGIVVNPTSGNQPLFAELAEEKYPIVFINRRLEGVNTDNVIVDNRKGATMAVEHFVRLKKQRLAALVYPYQGISTWQERIEGFEEALLKHGLDKQQYQIRVIDQREGAANAAVKQLMDGFKPDAIFSTNNMMTLEIMEAVKECGLTIPDDVALIGYDETVWSKHLNPPLTTVNQPAAQLGALAAQKLIKRIESKSKRPRASTEVLEPNLIVRRSCGSSNI
ncbi:LacI family DNA-binding transcriptional regulator [Paenibacillus sp.]|uniref:LacI family DNA-binding transcriptional regulator n=1 Tax=Paenibacillus sp. TaxID=58172 RepID=UPI002D73D444|nr:LacI family DNA-binding transcriptional regulator [Paenibacillus sp.]HZG87862.1 LacI family DNA-binding transcriptional regulator [Paenibacillus sp.]